MIRAMIFILMCCALVTVQAQPTWTKKERQFHPPSWKKVGKATWTRRSGSNTYTITIKDSIITFTVTAPCDTSMRQDRGARRSITFSWVRGASTSAGYTTCSGVPASAGLLPWWEELMAPFPEEVEALINTPPVEVDAGRASRTG